MGLLGESSWSEPISINIYGPELEIGEIIGGIDGIHVEIKNNGDADASNVNWNISVMGGLLGMIDKSDGGIISNLQTSTTESIFVFGLGNIELRVEASAPYTNTVTKTVTGFIVGIFVIIR